MYSQSSHYWVSQALQLGRNTNCSLCLGSLYTTFRCQESQAWRRRLPDEFQLDFSISCVWSVWSLQYGNIHILRRETWLLHYTFELSIIYHLKNLKEDFTNNIWKPTMLVQLNISYFQIYPEVLLILHLNPKFDFHPYILSTFHLAKYPTMKLTLNLTYSAKRWFRWLLWDV